MAVLGVVLQTGAEAVKGCHVEADVAVSWLLVQEEAESQAQDDHAVGVVLLPPETDRSRLKSTCGFRSKIIPKQHYFKNHSISFYRYDAHFDK